MSTTRHDDKQQAVMVGHQQGAMANNKALWQGGSKPDGMATTRGDGKATSRCVGW